MGCGIIKAQRERAASRPSLPLRLPGQAAPILRVPTIHSFYAPSKPTRYTLYFGLSEQKIPSQKVVMVFFLRGSPRVSPYLLAFFA